MTTVTDARRMLRHMLATLAYRTQKALRGAPAQFGDFEVGQGVRTPHELVRHMTQVIGSARSKLRGGTFSADRLPAFAEEVARFHLMLEALHADFGDPSLTASISDEQFLQGPLSDAMTHAGQLALLRRLCGEPVQAENFILAAVRTDNVSDRQPAPVAPDARWRPDGTRAPDDATQPKSGEAR
jgi:hypothetical protein